MKKNMKIKSDKNKQVEFKGVVIFCPKLNRKQIIEAEECEFISGTEMCGSNGYTEIYFQCKCGMNHCVIVKEW